MAIFPGSIPFARLFAPAPRRQTLPNGWPVPRNPETIDSLPPMRIGPLQPYQVPPIQQQGPDGLIRPQHRMLPNPFGLQAQQRFPWHALEPSDRDPGFTRQEAPRPAGYTPPVPLGGHQAQQFSEPVHPLFQKVFEASQGAGQRNPMLLSNDISAGGDLLKPITPQQTRLPNNGAMSPEAASRAVEMLYGRQQQFQQAKESAMLRNSRGSIPGDPGPMFPGLQPTAPLYPAHPMATDKWSRLPQHQPMEVTDNGMTQADFHLSRDAGRLPEDINMRNGWADPRYHAQQEAWRSKVADNATRDFETRKLALQRAAELRSLQGPRGLSQAEKYGQEEFRYNNPGLFIGGQNGNYNPDVLRLMQYPGTQRAQDYTGYKDRELAAQLGLLRDQNTMEAAKLTPEQRQWYMEQRPQSGLQPGRFPSATPMNPALPHASPGDKRLPWWPFSFDQQQQPLAPRPPVVVPPVRMAPPQGRTRRLPWWPFGAS